MKPAAEQKAFQVRLPGDVHPWLDAHSKSTGKSMNALVVESLRRSRDGDAIIPDAREDLVVAALSEEIGALKGVAQHYGNLGLLNLSTLLYGLSAEMTAATDPKLASKELIRTASRLPQRSELSIGVLRAALRHNPENEVAKNRLGQAMYFAGEYAQAVKYLASVRERDNHAKLFHGWASLHIARAADNRSASTQARNEIVVALEAWAFGNHDSRERARWLRQVAQLDKLGADYRQTVDELLDYANDNTSWAQVSREDLPIAAPTSLADDLEDLGSESGANQ